ncbi:Ger(x)C family spore germination protein [Paenibacillus sp. NEAU-GSW1]|uniref:Ger(x)C family spore germination protein n=1 Tax=Paenibacillus sp. NEAU-GSW1 TaxID=2682486 RepID=UPI0012E198D5|nr:Ger(x)C family spore germination protein [Paenibacillus sp. NEAU-GSW1]MUT68608.1 Ger(x)C family spore germination protein [Paenibacillus sp. NEAU-GSW1]
MMKRMMLLLACSALLLFLPGCWNKRELDQYGFAMAIAIDQGKGRQIELTTQMYRPVAGQKGGGGGGGTASETANLLIKTEDDSIFEAIRDIPIHLGRKASWSHMRIIVVGEKLARSTDIGKLIDFFYRDHEPRHTISIMIAKGRADKILEVKPAIEQTIGQQLLLTKQVAFKNAAKSLDTTLLKLALQMNSPNSDAAITYVYKDKKEKDELNAAGLALLKKGKMIGVLPSKKVEGLVMLRNEYKSGIIEVPCPGKQLETESFEVLNLSTKMKPKLTGDKARVTVKTSVEGAIGELKCTEIKSRKDEEAFIRKLDEQIKKEMTTTIRILQSKKMDIIDIGNMISKSNPNKWKTMKETWDNQFAELPFDIQVETRLLTTGTTIGKPSVSAENK